MLYDLTEVATPCRGATLGGGIAAIGKRSVSSNYFDCNFVRCQKNMVC